MKHRILVPLDGSPESESILPHLSRLFHRTDEVILFHVLPPVAPGSGGQPSAWLTLPDRAAAYLEDTRKKVKGLVSRGLFDQGAPADRILFIARREAVDFIAMTTHARGGLGTLLLGSVTEEVIDKGLRPTILVRPGLAARPGPLRRVLVPLDGTESSAPLLEPVRSLARSKHAEVVLLQMFPLAILADPMTGFMPIPSTPSVAVDTGVTLAVDLLKGVKTRILRAEGEVVDGILKHAKAVDADLIAMPTAAHGLDRALRGSFARDVLRKADLPVLLRHVQD